MSTLDHTVIRDPRAGMARLSAAIGVALSCFFCQSLLHYTLPLYFPAKGLSAVAWETWSYYEIIAWLFGPPLAGLLAACYGERRVWAIGLAAYACVTLWVTLLPPSVSWTDAALGAAGLWYGFASALIWVGGISLVQVVPESQRGLANGLMMTSVGVGSIAGPILGRLLVKLSSSGYPQEGDFHSSFVVFALLAIIGGLTIFLWGQYPVGGESQTKTSADRSQSITFWKNLALLRNRRYLSLVIPLSLLGGPVFQATNVYRPYRAREPHIGLIVGAEDHGWGALEVTGYVMQLVGGLLIGLVAGKKASGLAAALMLGSFALCGLGIGVAPNASVLFVFSALFELVRQFMRWVQTGYVSEHMPDQQRAAAIGLSVTLSGTGSWAFNSLTRLLQSPDSPGFSSSLPFIIAASLGFVGTGMLLATCRRRSVPPSPKP